MHFPIQQFLVHLQHQSQVLDHMPIHSLKNILHTEDYSSKKHPINAEVIENNVKHNKNWSDLEHVQ